MTVPVLQTERLTLRAHAMEDFPAYAAFMASDRARFMGGPLDERAAWAGFCRDVAQWPLLGHGALAIEVTASNALAGQVGLNQHPYFPDKELGWLVFNGFEAQGIAQEAARAMRDWSTAQFRNAPIASYIHTGNTASQKLAERLGASPDPAASCPYPDHVVYRHPKPEDA